MSEPKNCSRYEGNLEMCVLHLLCAGFSMPGLSLMLLKLVRKLRVPMAGAFASL